MTKLQRLSIFFKLWRAECKSKKTTLSSRDKDIIKLRRRGLTYREIGEKYGISKQRVFEIVNKNKGD